METGQCNGPTLRVYYRCDKVIKDNLEGEILWIGPSEKHVLVIETEPRDYLANPFLVDTMRKQIFNSLKQQPYVQALLQEGDTIDMALCEMGYDHINSWLMGPWIMNQTNLSRNQPIFINNDELGPYAELWITTIFIVNSQKRNHSVSSICGDTRDETNNDEIRAKKQRH